MNDEFVQIRGLIGQLEQTLEMEQGEREKQLTLILGDMEIKQVLARALGLSTHESNLNDCRKKADDIADSLYREKERLTAAEIKCRVVDERINATREESDKKQKDADQKIDSINKKQLESVMELKSEMTKLETRLESKLSALGIKLSSVEVRLQAERKDLDERLRKIESRQTDILRQVQSIASVLLKARTRLWMQPLFGAKGKAEGLHRELSGIAGDNGEKVSADCERPMPHDERHSEGSSNYEKTSSSAETAQTGKDRIDKKDKQGKKKT